MFATILGSCAVGAALVLFLGFLIWRGIRAKRAGKSITCGQCSHCCSHCSSKKAAEK